MDDKNLNIQEKDISLKYNSGANSTKGVSSSDLKSGLVQDKGLKVARGNDSTEANK